MYKKAKRQKGKTMKKYAEGLKLNEDQVNERARKFAKEMFGWEIPIRVKVEKRFTRTYGRCWIVYKPYPQKGLMLKELKISAYLVSGVFREKDIDDIIKHELLHWYTDITEQMNCGHNEVYKRNCERFGVNPQSSLTRPTIYQQEEEVEVKRRKPKRLKKNEYHKIKCSECGEVLYRSKNKTKLLQVLTQGYNAGCKDCKGSLIYKAERVGFYRTRDRGRELSAEERMELQRKGIEIMQ